MANHNSWAASAASRRQKAIDNFWRTVGELWGDAYDYSKFEYLGATTPTVVICRKHGEFTTRPTYLVNGNGCPTCGREKVAAAARSRELGLEAFIAKARALHGDKYHYPEQEYVGSKVKVSIVCPTHGVFKQKPNGHLSGRGCPGCANDGKRERNAMVSGLVRDGLLARLQGVNPDWAYDLDSFAGMGRPMQCTCRVHGPFSASPNNLLNNSGCRQCGVRKHKAVMESRRLTLDEVTARGRGVYGDRFEYLRVEHSARGAVVFGRCTEHNIEWAQAADGHATYNPCGLCTRHLSRGEDAVYRFLSSMTTAERRDRTIIRPKELDIYLPEHKLAVEYCGMFWHSSGSAGETRATKNKHHTKYSLAAAAGVRVLTLYESEWQERKTQVCRLLRAAVGKLRGSVPARKCALGVVTAPQARAFFDKYHVQGGAGSGEHYGLYWKGKLVACMRFTFGGNDRGVQAKDRTWTLSRYATRVNVVGGASRLFTAFLREHRPAEVKSFSDNRLFSGAMYSQLGFTLDAELEPDYQVWSVKAGLRPKAHYQRRLIPARLLDHGSADTFDPDSDPRTEADMTYAMGARRIYDCGKKRWLWKPLDPTKAP